MNDWIRRLKDVNRAAIARVDTTTARVDLSPARIPRKRGIDNRSHRRVGDGAGEGEGHGDIADMHPLPHLPEASDRTCRPRIAHSLLARRIDTPQID
jgi:hypothetical protein